MDFWPSLVIAFFGSLFGAGLAFLTAFFVRRHDEKARERAALNGLLVDLNLRRALVVSKPAPARQFKDAQDIKRCNRSVLACRDLIREARLNLLPESKTAFKILESMAGSCNSYLHKARIDSKNYQYFLGELQCALDHQARALGGLRGVDYRRPGGAAYGENQGSVG